MKDIKNARDFTVTIGLSNGNEYVYVTHRESGRQWMSKNEVSHTTDLSYVAGNILVGITKFDPNAVVGSCDARFWMPVKLSRSVDFIRKFGELTGI